MMAYALIMALIIGAAWAIRVAIVTDRRRKRDELAVESTWTAPTHGPWTHGPNCKCGPCR